MQSGCHKRSGTAEQRPGCVPGMRRNATMTSYDESLGCDKWGWNLIPCGRGRRRPYTGGERGSGVAVFAEIRGSTRRQRSPFFACRLRRVSPGHRLRTEPGTRRFTEEGRGIAVFAGIANSVADSAGERGSTRRERRERRERRSMEEDEVADSAALCDCGSWNADGKEGHGDRVTVAVFAVFAAAANVHDGFMVAASWDVTLDVMLNGLRG